MNRFVTYVVRFASAILAYAVASLAASIVLHTLYFGWPKGEAAGGAAGWLVFSVLFTALVAAYLAFIPAIIAILLSEIFARRWVIFYLCLGAAIGLIVSAALWQSGEEIQAQRVEDPLFWLVAVFAGAISGLVYWAIVGRRAGAWLPPRTTSPAP